MSAQFVLLRAEGFEPQPDDAELIARYNVAMRARYGRDDAKYQTLPVFQGFLGFAVPGDNAQYFTMTALIAKFAAEANVDMATITTIPLSAKRRTKSGLFIPSAARYEEPHA